uniref:F-box domain-containing protein n=1 Tax=Quercus lobata TaxID=97700 RepID=A0A7N2LGL4_QUELO
MREQPRPQPQILRQRNIYLPDDLVINNILTRLPVKSVMRFRRVCKSWYSSIKTSDFIDTHLSNYKDSHDNGYVIHMPSVRNTSSYRSPSSSSSSNTSIPVCTVAFDCTFDKISDVRIPFDVNFNQIVGSCNGLLCVANSGNVIYLWNPSIRKFKRLPDTLLGQLDNVTLGFAYHPENNDYKVVRISSTPFGAPVSYHEIEVYTLSSDSWRRVGITLTTTVILYDKNFPLPIPLVNGALHWISCIAEGEENHKSRTIMAFDVNKRRRQKNTSEVRISASPASFKANFGRFRPVSAYFGQFRPYRPYRSPADTTRYCRYGPILAEIGPIRRESKPIRRESSRVGANPADSARIREQKKKKKNSDAAGLAVNRVGRRVPRRAASDSGAPPSQPRPCFLAHGSIDENTFQTFLASFKGKLAFITWERSEQPGTQYSIWVMKEYGVVASWNKLRVVPFERVSHCSAFTENGSLLVCYINDQVEEPDFNFVLVDIETLHEKKDPDIQQHSYVATFMESLVLLDGANTVAY